MDKEWKQYKKALAAWELKRDIIKQTNERLIQKWRSIPWWRFWDRISFEEQRDIVLNNWNRLPTAPSMPMLNFYVDIKI